MKNVSDIKMSAMHLPGRNPVCISGEPGVGSGAPRLGNTAMRCCVLLCCVQHVRRIALVVRVTAIQYFETLGKHESQAVSEIYIKGFPFKSHFFG